MSSDLKTLAAEEEAKPTLVPKLRFPHSGGILTRRHEATKKAGDEDSHLLRAFVSSCELKSGTHPV